MANKTFIYTSNNGDRYLFKELKEKGEAVYGDMKCVNCGLNKGLGGISCGARPIYRLTGSCKNKIFKLMKIKRTKK